LLFTLYQTGGKCSIKIELFLEKNDHKGALFNHRLRRFLTADPFGFVQDMLRRLLGITRGEMEIVFSGSHLPYKILPDCIKTLR
jgi:hypothetical protein